MTKILERPDSLRFWNYKGPLSMKHPTILREVNVRLGMKIPNMQAFRLHQIPQRKYMGIDLCSLLWADQHWRKERIDDLSTTSFRLSIEEISAQTT